MFIFIFFSIPASKIVGYILPVIPALAILIAYTCDAQWQNTSLSIKVTSGYALVWLLVLVAGSFYVRQQPIWLGDTSVPWLISIAALLASLTWIYGIFYRCTYRFFIFFSLIVSTLFLLGFNNLTTHLYIDHSTKTLANKLRLPLSAETKVVSYYTYLPDFSLYTHHPVFLVADWPEHVQDPRDTDMAFYARKCAARFTACSLMIRPNTLQMWWLSPTPVYALVPKRRLADFEKTVGKYITVGQTLDELLLTNHKPKIYSSQK